ncbi:MAG: hypothetical protein WD075_00640 [Rhodospirillales bacterium]
MPKQTVSLSVELPTEVVELLATHGDELLAALAGAIDEAKRIAKSGLIQERRERVAQRSAERRDRIVTLGRHAHRLHRRRIRSMPASLSKYERADYREAAIDAVASELGEAPALIRIAIMRHKALIEPKVRERRFLSVLRRVLAGESNGTIADALTVHRNTVSLDIRRARERAAERGCSLSQLERDLTAERSRYVTNPKRSNQHPVRGVFNTLSA